MGEYKDFGGLSMNVKSDEERKSKVLKIRLNDKEFAKLIQYTEESSLRSMSEYIYNSILATPIIELTDEELAHEKARFKEISDRINSIAIQVNQTGNISDTCRVSGKVGTLCRDTADVQSDSR